MENVEPYEFRLPVPENVVEAMGGLSLANEGWLMAYFFTVSFHHWLRPNEALSLQRGDVVPIWNEASAFGLCRIGSPKIKHPPVQHVLTESMGVRLNLGGFR